MAESYIPLYPKEKGLGAVVANVPINYQMELDMLQAQYSSADKKDIPGMKEYEASLRKQIGLGTPSDTSNPFPLLPKASGDWLATGELPKDAPIQKAKDSVTDYLGGKLGDISFVVLGGLVILAMVGFTAYNSIREGK